MTDRAVPPIGFPLLPVPRDGRLAYPTLEQSVAQSIQVILRVRPGEIHWHPTFGAGLADLLDEPNSVTTRQRIRELVGDSIRRWEPRVDVIEVDAVEVEGKPDKVRVTLVYRVRDTGAVLQMGMTAELGG